MRSPRRPPERPIDRAWPALPLTLLGLAVLVALLGVLRAPEPSEVDRIDDAVQELAAATQERRGADACAVLTPEAAAAVAARIGTLGCADVVRSFGLEFDALRLRAATVRGARIDGDRAVVAREQLLVRAGEPFGPGLELRRLDGAWRVARVG